MAKVKVTAQIELIVEFDENNEDFKAIHEVYQKMIDPEDGYESMAINIAHNVLNDNMDIECIGEVLINGKPQTHTAIEGDNPINIVCDDYCMRWWQFDLESEVLTD